MFDTRLRILARDRDKDRDRNRARAGCARMLKYYVNPGLDIFGYITIFMKTMTIISLKPKSIAGFVRVHEDQFAFLSHRPLGDE